MQNQSAVELKHWQALSADDGYTWLRRQVGPWRLEVFPPESSCDDDDVPASYSPGLWCGQCEFDSGDLLEVEAETMPAAARLIEQAMAVMLTSVLMGLVGTELPDAAWETAVTLGE